MRTWNPVSNNFRARSVKAGWAAVVGTVALIASSVASANFTCEGKITYLSLNPDGAVNYAVNGFGVWGLCNLSTTTTSNGATTPPEACRGLYASMLAAQKSDTNVRVWFASSATTTNGTECTALGSWVAPNPAPYHIAFVY